MLPSTGYFKGENCPFYASGLCERPYCHFRHIRKDAQENNDDINNGEILQQLISEAVKKVLLHADVGPTENIISSRAVKQVISDCRSTTDVKSNVSIIKAIYNPTPISELNKLKETEEISTEIKHKSINETLETHVPKRHIPVPYTPHRPSKIERKRPVIDEQIEKLTLIDVNSIKAYTPIPTSSFSGLTYSPNSAQDKDPIPYKPEGSSNLNGTYLPGSNPVSNPQVYTPVGPSVKSSNNYVPTNIAALGKHIKIDNVYEPIGHTISGAVYEPGGASFGNYAYSPTSNTTCTKMQPSLCYEPTILAKPKYPCFSSDEDEPSPKKSKNEDSHEKLGLEDLDQEFDIIGQILDEENIENELKKVIESENVITKSKHPKEKSRKSLCKNSSESNFKDRRSKESSKKLDNANKHPKDSTRKSSTKSETSGSKDDKDSKHKKSGSKSAHSKHIQSSYSTSKSKHRNKSKEKESDIKKESKLSEKSQKLSLTKKDSNKKSNSSSKERRIEKSKDLSQSKLKSSSSHSPKSISRHKNIEQSTKKEDRTDKEQKSIKSDDDYSFDEDILTALSDSEPEDIDEECLKIFEEYTPVAKQHLIESESNKFDDTNIIYSGKKRVSHVTVPTKVHKPVLKPDFKIYAAQAMADRLSSVKEYHISRQLSRNENEREKEIKCSSLQAVSVNQQTIVSKNDLKKRIAHVPNISVTHNPATDVKKLFTDDSQPSTSTIVQSVAKGTSRTAHIPNDKFADRPGVLEPLGSKIAANIRSKFLHLMIDECLKIYLATEDAYARAQQEELSTSKKCSSIPIYRNSALMAISRLRKELHDAGGVKKGSDSGNRISHNDVLVGKLNHVSWSIENKHKKSQNFSEEFKGVRFYNNIAKWILTEQELQDNGFPRPHPSNEKGKAKIYIANTRQKPPKGNVRCCSRCKKDFTVDKKGFAVRKEECIYHPNNKYKYRGDVKYQCCSQDGTSDGCASAHCHVYEYVDYENLRGFIQTLPKEIEDAEHGVYALDCEMCYTTHGLDLTRVTVIDSTCKVIYESLVKPLYPIIDYNTRYSGITEEQMRNVKTTLLEVQATLLHMFSNKTILVGHSLESDFKALKIIHDTVIDTSVVYPHKMGPPFKRALRNLTSEYLKKIIQNSVEGHDSAEDATVCMELIQFKLKEELKLR